MDEKKFNYGLANDSLSVDELIITRLANDEKVLRRLAKRYRSIATYSVPSFTPPPDSKKDREELLNEAREGFLSDLDAFEMMLLKNQQVCSAESRMVRQYEMEKERIGVYPRVFFGCDC